MWSPLRRRAAGGHGHNAQAGTVVPLFPPPDADEIIQLLRDNFSPASTDRIQTQFETDLSFYCAGQRYRANFSKQKGLQSFSFRTVPQQRMKLQDLQLPASLTDKEFWELTEQFSEVGAPVPCLPGGMSPPSPRGGARVRSEKFEFYRTDRDRLWLAR